MNAYPGAPGLALGMAMAAGSANEGPSSARPTDTGSGSLVKQRPVVEEFLYRFALCLPLAVSLGPWKSIAVSGVAFAALHLIYGNPSPENLAGGLFLAWVYLKSESLALPILLHSLGNLLALLTQVGAWFWLASAG